ncbi:hypothetical protein KJ925_03665 [Patescibacteria group bacterium]|nr:hypothetical protein [Patescibacteria group bacterium]
MDVPPPGFLDPNDDSELINQFPNLIDLPDDLERRSYLENRYSVIRGESVRFRSLWRHLHLVRGRAVRAGRAGELAEITRDALHTFYRDTYALRPGDVVRDAALFADAGNAARETISFLLNEYFPLHLRKGLEMDSRVAGTHDLFALLDLCATRGSNDIARRRRFEARRQLTLAQIEFEMRVDHGDPQQLDDDIEWLVQTLDRRFFMPERSEQVVIVAELDPENAYRTKSFEVIPSAKAVSRVTPTPTRFVLPLEIRFFEVDGREIPVYFEARAKQRAALKLIAKRNRHHEILTDLRGAMAVFFDEEHDLMAGIDKFRRVLVRAPGSVSGEASNASRAGVLDPTNMHSSGEYRARKFDVRIRNRGFELQFKYLPFFVNEMVSHGRDNHQLYRVSKYLDLVFPVLFPTKRYGLDWRDSTLRQQLRDLQIAKI